MITPARNRVSKAQYSSSATVCNIKFTPSNLNRQNQSISKTLGSNRLRGRGRPKGSKNGVNTVNPKQKLTLTTTSSTLPSSIHLSLSNDALKLASLEPNCNDSINTDVETKYGLTSGSLDPTLTCVDDDVTITNSISGLDVNTSTLLGNLAFDLCDDDFVIKQEPLESPDISFMTPGASSPDTDKSKSTGFSGCASQDCSSNSSLPTPGFLLSPSSATSPRSCNSNSCISSNTNNSSKKATSNSNPAPPVRRSTRRVAQSASSMNKQYSKTVEPAPTKQKTTKRRPHSKSRHGCTTCKRRRVKCDETHPICNNCKHLNLECSFASASVFPFVQGGLNIMDIRLFHHYTTVVWKTIVAAGISNEHIWQTDVPKMAFEYPFLMHAVLTFSANHFSRIHKTEFEQDPTAIEKVVTFHRNDALKLLGEAVSTVTSKNLDALVASSILLILDSMANASAPNASTPSSLPSTTWLHHVRGAATILTAIGPPTQESRFFRLVSVDLSDLAIGLIPSNSKTSNAFSSLQCFDDDLKDLYPIAPSSPYFHVLCYLDKLFRQRYKSDFILRIFSFPALLDKNLVQMLINGDVWAKRIIRVYYRLVRSFTSEMKESVWFLEGVAKILPIDTDEEFGGLDFITKALPLNLPTAEEFIKTFLENSSNQQVINQFQRLNRSSSSYEKNVDACSSTSLNQQSSSSLETAETLEATPNGSLLSNFDFDSFGSASDLTSFASDFMMRTTSGVSSDPGPNIGDESASTDTPELLDSAASVIISNSQGINNHRGGIASNNSININNLVNNKLCPGELMSFMSGITSSAGFSPLNPSSSVNSTSRHNSFPSIGISNQNSLINGSRRATLVGDLLGSSASNIDADNSGSITDHLNLDRIRIPNNNFQQYSFQNHSASSNNGASNSSISGLVDHINLDTVNWKAHLASLGNPSNTVSNDHSPSMCLDIHDNDSNDLDSQDNEGFTTVKPSMFDQSCI